MGSEQNKKLIRMVHSQNLDELPTELEKFLYCLGVEYASELSQSRETDVPLNGDDRIPGKDIFRLLIEMVEQREITAAQAQGIVLRLNELRKKRAQKRTSEQTVKGMRQKAKQAMRKLRQTDKDPGNNEQP
jgi:hypothetical protein